MGKAVLEPSWEYEAELIGEPVDGDTFDLAVRLWPQRIYGDEWLDMGFSIYQKTFAPGEMTLQRVRLAGVDTWEIRGEERERGLLAKEFVEAWFTNFGNECIVRTEKWRGKYGRYVAWVYPPLGHMHIEVSLNQRLLEAGHGEVPNY